MKTEGQIIIIQLQIELTSMLSHSRKGKKKCWNIISRIRSGLTTPRNLSCCNYTVGGGSPTGEKEKIPTQESSGWNKKKKEHFFGTSRRSECRAGGKKKIQSSAVKILFLPHGKGTYPAWWHPLHRLHRTRSGSARVKAKPSNEQSVQRVAGRACCNVRCGNNVVLKRNQSPLGLCYWLVNGHTIPGANRSDQTCMQQTTPGILTTGELVILHYSAALYAPVFWGWRNERRFQLHSGEEIEWVPPLISTCLAELQSKSCGK